MKNKTDLPRALALAEEYEMFPRGCTVLAAVSGGRDSMTLLHWLDSQKERLGITLAVGHYHHGLRPEADADLELVESWCRERNIKFFAQRGRVAEQAARTGKGLEETGRELRYAFLEQTAQQLGGARIATAHNADDNAETLLLHLVRGSGLQGLTGIPPRRENVVRPLLTTTRAEIEAYVQAHNLPWAEDATNADPVFSRNRLRHQVTPVLEGLNPRYVDGVGRTIALLRTDEDFLQEQAALLFAQTTAETGGIWFPCELLVRTHAALTSRLVLQGLERVTGSREWSLSHVQAVLELARSEDPSAQIDLPHGVTARRVYDRVGLTVEKPAESWTVTLSGPTEGLVVRARQEGDELRLPNRPRKSLKKWMIEKKIPRHLRETLPVVADDRGVLAAALVGENTDHPLFGAVQVTWIKNEE